MSMSQSGKSGMTSLPSDGTTAWSSPAHIQIYKHKTDVCLTSSLQKTRGLQGDRIVKWEWHSRKCGIFNCTFCMGFNLVFYVCAYSKWLFDGKSPSVFYLEFYFANDAQWDFAPLSSLPNILESMRLFFLMNQKKSLCVLSFLDLVPNNNFFLICMWPKEKLFSLMYVCSGLATK